MERTHSYIVGLALEIIANEERLALEMTRSRLEELDDLTIDYIALIRDVLLNVVGMKRSLKGYRQVTQLLILCVEKPILIDFLPSVVKGIEGSEADDFKIANSIARSNINYAIEKSKATENGWWGAEERIIDIFGEFESAPPLAPTLEANLNKTAKKNKDNNEEAKVTLPSIPSFEEFVFSVADYVWYKNRQEKVAQKLERKK